VRTQNRGSSDAAHPPQVVSLQSANGEIVHELNQPIPAINARERVQQQKKDTQRRWNTCSERDRGTSTEVHKRVLENHSDKEQRHPTDILNDKTLQIRDEKNKETGVIRQILFCMVCSMLVNANKVACKSHLSSESHARKKKEKEKLISENTRLEIVLREYLASHQNLKGANIEEKIHSFRMKTVRYFLQAGLPLSKIDILREFLEEFSGIKLTSSSNMKLYVPIVLKLETNDIKALIQESAYILVIYDGTTRVDDVFCVVLRFVLTNFNIIHKLVALDRYLKNGNHEELVNAVIRALQKYEINMGHKEGNSTVNSIIPSKIIGWQRDRCSVNTAAKDYLESIFVGSKDLKCLSHTLTHVGDHCKMTKLKPFLQDLIGMMNSSGGGNKAQAHWISKFNKRWRNPGNTRWWATFDYVILFLFDEANWNTFLNFIHTASDEGGIEPENARINRLTATITNHSQLAFLKLEVDAVAIICKRLIEATYELEGDGPCGIIAYECIRDAHNHLKSHMHDPSTFTETFNGTLHRLSDHMNSCRDSLMAGGGYGNNIIHEIDVEIKEYVYFMAHETLTYFEKVIFNNGENGLRQSELHSDILVYRVCGYMSPLFIRSNPNLSFNSIRADVKALDHFSDETLDMMEHEWSTYLARCADIPVEDDDKKWKVKMRKAQEFWKFNWIEVPTIAQLARYSFTITSSSAAAERVFSTLKNSISLVQMHASLEDLTTVSIMSQYNHKQEEE
jgi:hypothetical protein